WACSARRCRRSRAATSPAPSSQTASTLARRFGVSGRRWAWRWTGIDRARTRASLPFPRRGCRRKPERLTMAEAAAVGRSHWVAWETLINMMEIIPGETMLVTGGGGMVGRAATAIARWPGAEVIIAGQHRPDGVERFI